jgi:coenzyme F420-reducing hydrogenase gamma subunit
VDAPSVRPTRPTLAVWKFASCDGCQLSLLDCEDELLSVAGAVDIAYFPEASSAMAEGPYDISLVEGSISTADDLLRIHRIREQSRVLVVIGACATAGGIQALRNLADVGAFAGQVYPDPSLLDVLANSTPIADHVSVDAELRGCPIDREQLIEALNAMLNHRPLRFATTSVCNECKARQNRCVLVADGAPCLGPVTQAGCHALCPAYHRGCYGCFGPMESPNTASLAEWFERRGHDRRQLNRLFNGINGWAPAFREEAARHEPSNGA